jgi:hypothetical protein
VLFDVLRQRVGITAPVIALLQERGAKRERERQRSLSPIRFLAVGEIKGAIGRRANKKK